MSALEMLGHLREQNDSRPARRIFHSKSWGKRWRWRRIPCPESGTKSRHLLQLAEEFIPKELLATDGAWSRCPRGL